ncbi:MAG: MarR family transcriptional regulator [Firmicutes bacterium]|nr:MarR family transcriptional regulator [Bacillota bacterium]
MEDPEAVRASLVELFLALCRLVRRRTSPVHRGELTHEQFWLLRRLERNGPMRVTALADAMEIGQSAATLAVQRLERAGLVCRHRQTEDERVVLVSLTEAGRLKLASWHDQQRREWARLLSPLSGAEQDELERLLARLLSAEEVQQER